MVCGNGLDERMFYARFADQSGQACPHLKNRPLTAFTKMSCPRKTIEKAQNMSTCVYPVLIFDKDHGSAFPVAGRRLTKGM